MIPDLGALERTAADVLKRIPPGLTEGEIATGVYGLGFVGRAALPKLRQRGVRLVSCHDANAALNGMRVDGLPVHASCELKASHPDFLFVTARHAVRPVSAMLAGLGIAHVSYDAWHAASDFAAFADIHERLLGDERSKAVLRAVLTAMLSGDPAHCEAVYEKDQYFCLPRFCGSMKETYVDAGAYVGDSVERFIWTHAGVFDKIYAFEPGARQFAALKTRVARLVAEWALDPGSIEIVNAGLGEADRLAAAANGNGQPTNLALGAGAPAGGPAVRVVSLDQILDGAPVTFLKADVEGMEMNLLKGASTAIARHRPKLAICAYHHPSDIPDITNYLHRLVPDYRFALRHHSPQLMETVLYCWVD